MQADDEIVGVHKKYTFALIKVSDYRTMIRSALNHIVVSIATYYATSFVQAFFHRIFGHTRRIATLYDVHVGGHHAQYARQLLSDRWIPFTPMVLTAFWWLPLSLFAVHAVSLTFAIWWHVFLHRKYHLRGVWLERFEWFRKKRRLHFVHHRRPRSNYAIVEYGWDRLLGTFEGV
jgi:sterol desaturase/sphingolipid hydroxylase (fatty acid hydroxylase superfamily)